jgi:hemerythrin-like domain-containing protein
MAKTLEKLHQEHVHISRLLDVLEKQVLLLEESEQADTRLLADIAEYIMNYPDLYHHPQEDLVFELLRHKDNEIIPVIDRLINEHKIMTEMAITLSELLGGSKKEEKSPQLINLLSEYIVLSRSHMNIEEEKLFPRAKQILTDNDWTEIDTGFTCQGDPLFGELIHKQYKNIYNSIIN